VVNLSDLAAMGASPLGFTLSLALPNMDDAWIKAFARGLFAEAERFNCPLIGGDTCAGPLTINITALGSVPSNHSMRRSGAQNHDDIWVSGTVGDARLALAHVRNESNVLHEQEAQIRRQCAAAGGDDYELCFTADQKHRLHIQQIANDLGITLTCIGQLVENEEDIQSITLLDHDGKLLRAELTNALLQSFDHFK